VGLAPRRFLERPHDHLFDLRVADPARRTGARLVIQPVQALADEPSAPFTNGDLRHPQPFRDDLVVDALDARENDPRTTGEVRCRPR
jgi:hypothetical protein